MTEPTNDDLPPKASDDAADEAAVWDVRLRSPSCSDEDREAFGRWRRQRPENAEAFDELQASLCILRASRSTDPNLRAVRERARGVVGGSGRRWRLQSAVAAVLVVGVLAALSAYRMTVERPRPPSVYRTVAGERSTLHLTDGSVVTLNANTEVHVAFKRKARAVSLVAGEAAFKVAKDAERPFSVAVAGVQVVAVGTAFNIRVDPSEMRVTMMEGRVRVDPEGAARKPQGQRFLVAGQRMTARTGAGEVEIAEVNVANETAWLENKIVFRDDPLSRAVERYNASSGQDIRLGDPSLAGVPISGMFRTNQPESFLDALTSYYSLKASRNAGGEIVLTRK